MFCRAIRAWAVLAAAFAALTLLAATASATAPENDDFADAELLTGDSPEATGSTDGATAEAGEPNRLGDMAGNSVWFRWTADRSGLILVRCSSAFDAIVAVYTGSSLTGLTEVGSDHSGFECASPELLFRAHAGTEYRIAVDARLGGGAGGFTLALDDLSERPANDDFAAAAAIPEGADFRGDTAGAGREPGEPRHGGEPNGSSVWFRWTAPRSAPMNVYPCDGSFHPVIDVYAGNSLSGLSQVSTAGNVGGALFNCGLGGLGGATFEAVAGTTYSIAVDGAGGEWGWFRMELRETPRDLIAPETELVGRVHVRGRIASVDFRARYEPGPVHFLCRLDRRPFGPCVAPKVYGHLSTGRHRVEVKAVDAAGNEDPVPATAGFRIRKPNRHGGTR